MFVTILFKFVDTIPAGNTYLGPPISTHDNGTNNNNLLKTLNKQQATHRLGLKVVIPTSRPGMQNVRPVIQTHLVCTYSDYCILYRASLKGPVSPLSE